jgi:hypothetical protein
MSDQQRRSLAWVSGLVIAICGCAGAYFYAHRSNSGKETATSADAPTPVVMDEAQRTYLWEIENRGNRLTRLPVGFRALGSALSQADQKKLTDILDTSFSGDSLGQPLEEVRVANEFAEAVRQQDAGSPKVKFDRPGFVNELLKYRRPFSKPPKVQIALMTLSPEDRNHFEGVWKGSCQLRMFGEMGPGKPGEVILHIHYTIPEPSEENLKAGWLRSASIVQIQTAKAPRFLMKEVTEKRGIDVKRFHDNWRKEESQPKPNTGGVYLCDFDRDGILDMLIHDVKGIVLYKGQPDGTFRDVTAEVGLPTSRGMSQFPAYDLCGWADLNGDGWEDLILGGRIYRNEEGKRFTDVTELSNLSFPKDAVGLAVADYDRDGKLDLYVTRPGETRADSWLTGKSGDPNKVNQLWRNKGNWHFENVTAKTGAGAGNRSSFSAVWLDVNNDGWPDLYVINEFGSGVLLVNNQDGTFREHLLAEGPNDFGSMGVTCGDFDNDGNIDIFCGNMYSKAGNRVINNILPGTYPEEIMAKIRAFVAGNQLWHNRGNLKFEPMAKKYQVAGAGWAYGPQFVDLDNDGWLDIFANAGFVSQDPNEPDG